MMSVPRTTCSVLLALALAACQPDAVQGDLDFDAVVPAEVPEDLELAPPAYRSAFLLSLNSNLEPGQTSFYLATGANPGETVFLVGGTNGQGSGPCPPQIGGLCLDVRSAVSILGSGVANVSGFAVIPYTVPANMVPGTELSTQAVIQRGPGGANSIKTPARTDAVSAAVRTTPTSGNALAMNAAGTVAVAANRTAGEITVISLTLGANPSTGNVVATFDLAGEEPWNVVIGNDNDTAYVTLRASKQVARITGLSTGSPQLDTERADVDGDPTGIAISPTGQLLYVSNWSAGTVSVVDAQSLATVADVDLNQALIDTGTLGPSVSQSRKGLAHPSAVLVTNDGDGSDQDEWVYVTEFFSQDDPSADPGVLGDAYFDEGRQGFVYRFHATVGTMSPAIPLGSTADTGFLDSTGGVTGCFPNQLSALAQDGTRVYAAGMCASPRGPAGGGGVNAKTKVHPTLYAIDTVGLAEVPAERVTLTEAFQDLYDTRGRADDATRRFPLLPNAMAFAPNTHVLYVAGYGSDALFRVRYNANHTLNEVGSSLADFINVGGFSTSGKLPIGVAIDAANHALVLNENTRNLSFANLGTQSVVNAIPSASPVAPDEVVENTGRRFFVTGLARWSLNGQGWNSCEGCHPNGLTDNVTWFFPAGPRQTVSLDGSWDQDAGVQRVFNWTAILDEIGDFENNTRGISGGVGAFVSSTTLSTSSRIVFDGTHVLGSESTDASQVNLNGSMDELVLTGVPGVDATGAPTTVQSVLEDFLDIDDYVKTVRSPDAPVVDGAAALAGAAIFQANNCQGCHGGTNWTVSERFYTPSTANNAVGGLLETTTYSRGTLPAALNPAAASGPAPLKGGGTIQCVLRGVGTFPAAGTTGIAPAGVTVSERKENMSSTANGLTGFNPPSLLGVVAGAPYFHAGNARTLEEVFDPTFEPHHQALSANFVPTPTDIANLTAFLTWIDDDATTLSTDVAGIDTILCPDVFP